jgi:hypothetical protein
MVEVHSSRISPAESTGRGPVKALVGQWPEPTSWWSVIGAGSLWALWVAFLVWMVVLRIESSSNS